MKHLFLFLKLFYSRLCFFDIGLLFICVFLYHSINGIILFLVKFCWNYLVFSGTTVFKQSLISSPNFCLDCILLGRYWSCRLFYDVIKSYTIDIESSIQSFNIRSRDTEIIKSHPINFENMHGLRVMKLFETSSRWQIFIDAYL